VDALRDGTKELLGEHSAGRGAIGFNKSVLHVRTRSLKKEKGGVMRWRENVAKKVEKSAAFG
jgi:hypothetical protein